MDTRLDINALDNPLQKSGLMTLIWQASTHLIFSGEITTGGSRKKYWGDQSGKQEEVTNWRTQGKEKEERGDQEVGGSRAERSRQQL